MAKTILQAINDKLSASGVTVADGLDGKGLTISEAIAAIELDSGGITPTGTLTLTDNVTGMYATNYAKAVVSVYPILVTYDANGGSGSILPTPGIRLGRTYYENGTSLTPPEGKKFKCWCTATEPGTGAVELYYSEGAFINYYEDTTLYAIWEDA